MQEINAALTAASALLGIARAALEARDDAKVKKALTELQQKLFEATSAALDVATKAMTLQGALSEAQNEIRALKAKTEEREAYTLVELRPGAYAYARKPADGVEKHSPPYFCQPCHDNGAKSTLQHYPATKYNRQYWRCSEKASHQITSPEN